MYDRNGRTRAARCGCGSLTVTTTGEPAAVYACGCLSCQRKSGSAFTYSAVYPEAAVSMAGEVVLSAGACRGIDGQSMMVAALEDGANQAGELAAGADLQEGPRAGLVHGLDLGDDTNSRSDSGGSKLDPSCHKSVERNTVSDRTRDAEWTNAMGWVERG